MRTKIIIVPDPKIIKAELLEFRQPQGTPKKKQDRILKIRITTDKIKEGFFLDPNKIKLDNVNLKDRKSYMSFSRIPVYINFKLIRCTKNRKTRYKDFFYLLRNPHTSLLFINTDSVALKMLALKIIEGYKVIFPREIRYFGNITTK